MEFDIDKVDFNKSGGLIPAIVQDFRNKEVLMLAYMSKESLKKTILEKKTWFYSRSRNELWNKGETSGHLQYVKEMYIDCDLDTILILVEQVGVACHMGERSCFFTKIETEIIKNEGASAQWKSEKIKRLANNEIIRKLRNEGFGVELNN